MDTDGLERFLSAIRQSLSQRTFVKFTLNNYRGNDVGLLRVLVRKITVKKEEKLSFTYHYKTRDIIKNYTPQESIAWIGKHLQEGFHAATLFTLDFDLQATRHANETLVLHKHKPSHSEPPADTHDRAKKRLIQAGAGTSYLHALGITNATGQVLPTSQDKYRQINKYTEILSALIRHLPQQKLKNVVDMGCGKGYLTFALYDYLAHTLKLKTQVTGVEARPELVTLCNAIANDSGFERLHFAEGSIAAYEGKDINILIALHACDTATDDAIFKGIQAGAELIVVAPCCHKQIRREMETHRARNEVEFLIKHGIFMERQAEMITDGLRAMFLEYFGYSTKIFEFISDAHTAKNVMIAATRNPSLPLKNSALLDKIQQTKRYFGIGEHYMERVLGIVD